MTGTEPINSIAWRVTVLEREIEALKAGKPDVVAERVARLSTDIDGLRREVQGDMGALREQIKSGARVNTVFYSGVAVAIIAAVVSVILTGGTP